MYNIYSPNKPFFTGTIERINWGRRVDASGAVEAPYRIEFVSAREKSWIRKVESAILHQSPSVLNTFIPSPRPSPVLPATHSTINTPF